jgi:uncharacterized NAD(P)/FAD-binding protein YdhS
MMVTKTPLRVGIVGAGFSGTALVAHLHRFGDRPLNIILFDKTGIFGQGDAYRTPYSHHLLNVRSQDMSVFQDDPEHFTAWLSASSAANSHLNPAQPIGEQFVPRMLYGRYLQDVLHQIHAQSPSVARLDFEPSEVIDIQPQQSGVCLSLRNKKEIIVDKVILALGNNPPSPFPFPVSPDVMSIRNPWDYTALSHVKPTDPVLIVGTGLSMIDAVLTLYHQGHQGNIHALSRHGLLPLAHADAKVPYVLLENELPTSITQLTRYLRRKAKQYLENGGDWRSMINALREHVPTLWSHLNHQDKRQFLRHILPYWNVHRHRVHHQVADLLTQLKDNGQLHILKGRVVAVESSHAEVKLRGTQTMSYLPVKCVVNCMGPQLMLDAQTPTPTLISRLIQRGIAKLDRLQLGLAVNDVGAALAATGDYSNWLYTVGSIRKSVEWECSAVPEIRKQSARLAAHLLS